MSYSAFFLLRLQTLDRRWRFHLHAHNIITMPLPNHALHDSETGRRNFERLQDGSKPALSVNTNVTRHRARLPQQVFPREPRRQHFGLMTSADSKDSKALKKLGDLKQHLQTRLILRPGPQRSITASRTDAVDSMSSRRTAKASANDDMCLGNESCANVPPLHKRVKGLRPSPLNLNQDASPSDRAITIGLAIPSAELPHRSGSLPLVNHPTSQLEEPQTPAIVVTPAKEEFGLSRSVGGMEDQYAPRPTSSIYSRYTTCLPKGDGGSPPPVPPLPLFVTRQALRESAVTVFEEEAATPLQPPSPKRLTTQSHLPTPRRSRGWWNLITSPFSAKSNGRFFRSPPLLQEEHDHVRMLDDASDMGIAGSGSYRGEVVFFNRTPDEGEARTAFPPHTGSEKPPVPKRSETAPAALTAGDEQIDIYRIPSQGLAAAYYDKNNRFASLSALDAETLVFARDSQQWSPSQSVAHPEDSPRSSLATDSGSIASSNSDQQSEASTGSFADRLNKPTSETIEDVGRPCVDCEKARSKATPPAQTRGLFSNPSEDELTDAPPSRPTMNERSNTQATQATMMSAFSPLTSTPIVQQAYTARRVQPDSDSGEVREVDLPRARIATSSPLLVGGLGAATMASRSAADERPPAPKPGKPYCRPFLNERNDSSDSVGLGICDLDDEKPQFPPSRPVREHPRLVTDRFGQLTVRDTTEQKPTQS